MCVYGIQDTLVSPTDVDQDLSRLLVPLKNAGYVVVKVVGENVLASLVEFTECLVCVGFRCRSLPTDLV